MSSVLAPIVDDAFIYYALTRPFEAICQAALPPKLGYETRECHVDLSGSDSRYRERCPEPWIVLGGAADATTVRAAFNKPYFDACKTYVDFALKHKPTPASSAKARVLWAVDTLAHVNFALAALNIPIHGLIARGIEGSQSSSAVLSKFYSAMYDGYKNIALTRGQNVTRYVADPRVVEQYDTAPIMPACLAVLPFMWAGLQEGRADQVYERLFSGIVPMKNGYSLQSYKNRDATALAKASVPADLALMQGILQWRMWAVRDGISFHPLVVLPSTPDGSTIGYVWIQPDRMGSIGSCVSLPDFIHTVSYQDANPKLELRNDKLWPNFGHSLNMVANMAGVLLSLNFETEVRSHFKYWVGFTSPRIDSAGNLAVDSKGYYEDQPLTGSDIATFIKGRSKQLLEQAQAQAQSNPAAGCPKGDTNCIKFANAMQNTIMKSPAAPFYNMMFSVASKLLKLFGASGAIGGIPFFAIETPFVRSFADYNYNLEPIGPSLQLLPRVVQAMSNYEALTGWDLCEPCAPVPTTAKPITPTPTPARPPAPPPLPAAVAPDPATVCSASIDSYLKKWPNYKISSADKKTALAMCQDELAGKKSNGSTIAFLDQKRVGSTAISVKDAPKPSKVAPVVVGTAAGGIGLFVALRLLARFK